MHRVLLVCWMVLIALAGSAMANGPERVNRFRESITRDGKVYFKDVVERWRSTAGVILERREKERYTSDTVRYVQTARTLRYEDGDLESETTRKGEVDYRHPRTVKKHAWTEITRWYRTARPDGSVGEIYREETDTLVNGRSRTTIKTTPIFEESL